MKVDCSHTIRAGQLGDHRGSGGCCRNWIGQDELRHQCRASRGTKQCRCPCGEVFLGQADTVPAKKGRQPKVSEEAAEAIRGLYKTTRLRIPTLARMYRVSTATINAVIEQKGAYRADSKNPR